MTNARINRAMHPTNLHVNKTLYPNDTVNGRLPDPAWVEEWLRKEICFDRTWEKRVEDAILENFSSAFGQRFESSHDLRRFHKQFNPRTAITE